MLIEFVCPDPLCLRPCRLSEEQRAVQHSDPVCGTWRALKGKPEEFLAKALMAAKGNLILGTTGQSERQLSDAEREPTADKDKARLMDQIYEGMKKL